jgi:EAL domain-containing protein (putative c-di-GMP-specific phosphodiesterase class I)
MFKAKRGETVTTGYAYYNQEIHQGVAGRLFLEAALRRALERQEFSLQYQPKVDIVRGNIVGVEALLRWQHPERGLILPAEFIAVAEETGMILQMDAWVLERACAQARLWRESGHAPFPVSVNLSAKEFSPELPARIRTVLDKFELEPEWLELEITEGMLMNSAISVIDIMRQIAGMGVSLALDDFGTGYSSLSYLKRFPISRLKIDRSFIRGIPDDAGDCAISGAIIGLGKQLKQRIVAEGVENMAQFSYLKDAGCDEVQGYLFSRPVDADKLDQLLHAGIHFAL